MVSRNKGKKSALTKSQIDVVKFFRDFGVNILRHKVIYGIMVVEDESGNDVDSLKLVGFVSTPLDELSKDWTIEDKATKTVYGIFGNTTIVVDKNFCLENVEADFNIYDKCCIMEELQEAVDNGLCSFAKEFDILFMDRAFDGSMEDLSNDINER